MLDYMHIFFPVALCLDYFSFSHAWIFFISVAWMISQSIDSAIVDCSLSAYWEDLNSNTVCNPPYYAFIIYLFLLLGVIYATVFIVVDDFTFAAQQTICIINTSGATLRHVSFATVQCIFTFTIFIFFLFRTRLLLELLTDRPMAESHPFLRTSCLLFGLFPLVGAGEANLMLGPSTRDVVMR